MKINFIYSPNVSLEQMLGYEMAALTWGKLFTDNIEVNIFAKSTDKLNANVIGGATPEFHEQHYALFLEYFAADITSENDLLAYEALQQGNTVDFLLDGEVVDGNTKLKLTTALAKALGMDEAISLDRYVLDEDDYLFDGTVMMNQNFSWDFNYIRDEEAEAGTLDFLSVALHETGHILGFTSSLDFSLQEDTLYSGRTELSNFSPLDLFRFSAESMALDNPDGVVNDLSIGGTAWFSTNGGETLSAKLSTGKDGDGFQASHWERRYDPLGIMDPTLWYQERAEISDLDVLAFDVMGYDLSESAEDVEDLFEQENLELSLARAKVQLAAKLGVTVEWIEANADVPVSSPELIAQIETENLEAEEIIEAENTEIENSEIQASPENLVDEISPKTSKELIRDLDKMMRGVYRWWAASSGSQSSSWQELFEWWAASSGSQSSSWQELFEWWAASSGSQSSSWQELFEWWAASSGSQSSSWQELFEWWAASSGSQSSSWQELFEWWAASSGSQSSSWQELFEWWAASSGSQSSWWQEAFYASQDDNSSIDLQLPGSNNNPETHIVAQKLRGGGEDDIIGGDLGNDLIVAGDGDDLIDGAAGDDTILGGKGFDTIFGFDGNDSIKGNSGDDLISGESGEDALFGQAGDDVLMGGDNDDYLEGGEGRDFLNGNTGHDALIGGEGDDALEGESGKDLLVGGEGKDLVNGGSGDDFIFGDRYSESLKQNFGSNLNNLTKQFVPTTDTEIPDEETIPTEFIYSGLDSIRVEAETMTLTGSFNAGQKAIYSNSSSILGSAITTFVGESGYYEIRVRYFDENNGDGLLMVNVDGQQIDSWILNENTSDIQHLAMTRTVSHGLYLDHQSNIEIQGLRVDEDNARVNYLEFIPVEPITPQNNADSENQSSDEFIYLGLNHIKMETEDMNLAGGYVGSEDSNAIWLDPNSVAGLASSTFTGESGYYQVIARYSDKNTGTSSVDVKIGGQQIDSWLLDNNTGETSFSDERRTLSEGLYIDANDTIQIRGIAGEGDYASVDYLEFIPVESQAQTNPSDIEDNNFSNYVLVDRESIVMQAEDMNLAGGYVSNENSNVVWLNPSSVAGSASSNFTGESGYYQVVVRYSDKNTGTSSIDVKIGGQQIDSWLLNNNTGETQFSSENRTISEGLYIDTNDLIQIRGIKETGDDNARFDYIEFIPVELVLDEDTANNSNEPTKTPEVELPPQLDLGINSDILRGGAGNDGIDGGEGNDVIFGEDEFNDSSLIYAPLIEDAFTYGHSSYILTDSIGTWQEAQAEAEIYGGNLVTINDAAEEDWLRNIFGTSKMWIGMTDIEEEGVWQWSSGEAVTYTNWKINEPDNYQDNEHYAAINYFDNGQWNDRRESGSVRYRGIIEIDWSSIGGNDTIVGGAGDDRIYGNTGNELIYGDRLSDTENLETLSFQQGVNGYASTVDTWIHGDDPDASFGNDSELTVDGDWYGKDTHILLRFEDIFGSQLGQISSSDVIDSATLELSVTNYSDGIAIYELLQDWSESDTWNSLGNGIHVNNIEAKNTPLITTNFDTGTITIDVTSSLQEWQQNPDSNYGWAFLPTTDDNAKFFSSESDLAPKLTVELAPDGNDTLTGNGGHDTLNGGGGNDILNGTDEIVAGYLEKDLLIGGVGADTFVLGDETQAYYATGGNQDYAIIEDFNFAEDSFRLFGSADNYYVEPLFNDSDIGLYSQEDDLVAILENGSSLGDFNLNGSYVEYV